MISFNELDLTEKEKSDLFSLYRILRSLYLAKSATKEISTLIMHSSKECHLRCKYCIAKVNEKSNSDKAILMIPEIKSRFNIKNIHFIGGEPTFNWDHIYKTLDQFESIDRISLTTNCLGLTQKHMDRLKSISKDVFYQVSLEPTCWNQRLFPNGIHQNRALERVFKNINVNDLLGHNKSFINLTLPASLKRDEKYGNWNVEGTINEIDNLLGYDKWSSRWGIEGLINKEDNVQENLPDYIRNMIDYEFNFLKTNLVSINRIKKGPFYSMLIGLSDTLKNTKYPGRFVQCAIGSDAINISHDGNIYGCSSKASIGSKNDIDGVSTDLYTHEHRWNVAKNGLDNFNDNECSSCLSKFICGKTCCDKIKTSCDFLGLYQDKLNIIFKKYFYRDYVFSETQSLRLLEMYRRNPLEWNLLLNSEESKKIMNGDFLIEDIEDINDIYGGIL